MSDAGWRKQDGLRDDMWRCMAWSPTPRDRRETGEKLVANCPYALFVATFKDGKEWDAQTREVYRCHMGSHLGRQCIGDKAQCDDVYISERQPGTALAKRVLTGGLIDSVTT